MKVAIAILITLVLFTSGCTTGEKVSDLREGLNRTEVESILGEPDGFIRDGNYVGYTYINRLISGWGWDRADYHVIFKDDRVIQWGAGTVRQGSGPNVGTLVLVPLR